MPRQTRISINDLIVRACALALQRTSGVQRRRSKATRSRSTAPQNICIAIALDDGLIAPALLDVGTKSLLEIARETRRTWSTAVEGRRAARRRRSTAGTFTITNLGAYGVETLIGIIQPPQTAILGVGSVIDQPAVRDGVVVVRQMMKVALSADHRVTDGAQGAQFLSEIKGLLEQPLLLVL